MRSRSGKKALRLKRVLAVTATLALAPWQSALALEAVQFDVKGGDEAVTTALRAASGVLSAEANGTDNAQELFAVARAEYGRLLGALYALGHYSAVIDVLVNGREAATIAALDAPDIITSIAVTVSPGPNFTFGKAVVTPLAPKTVVPEGFAVGQIAKSGVIREAAQAGLEGWRNQGHAKATLARQDLVADHPRAQIDADLGIHAGPRLRFGALKAQGLEHMDPRRFEKIAGLPEGAIYSPQIMREVANRLRRTGVFRSVSLEEDEQITAPDYLGVTAIVVEEQLRRYSYGIEVSSDEGAKLSGYWLHRNLLGGGERLRVDGSVAQIGGVGNGADYVLGATIDRPATLTPDTSASLKVELGRLNEEDYTNTYSTLGVGFTQFYSETLTLRAGFDLGFSQIKDARGTTNYRMISLPLGATWDRRNSQTDATKGWYLDAEARPFYGLAETASGVRLKGDVRGYYSVGERITLAGRLQFGSVLGAKFQDTPREYLFYSGGGGTVRGQPYQSLGVYSTYNGVTLKTGGEAFAAVSAELRSKVTETIGVVGFIDMGFVGKDGFSSGERQAGAGLGLRYATGFGPLRLDVAAPVSGKTGDGVQIYIGIGQAF